MRIEQILPHPGRIISSGLNSGVSSSQETVLDIASELRLGLSNPLRILAPFESLLEFFQLCFQLTPILSPFLPLSGIGIGQSLPLRLQALSCVLRFFRPDVTSFVNATTKVHEKLVEKVPEMLILLDIYAANTNSTKEIIQGFVISQPFDKFADSPDTLDQVLLVSGVVNEGFQ